MYYCIWCCVVVQAGKGAVEGVFDQDADVPMAIVVGSNATAMSVATHLLKKRWNVHLIVTTRTEAAHAKEAIRTYAEALRVEERKTAELTTVIVNHVVGQPVARVKGFITSTMNTLSGDGDKNDKKSLAADVKHETIDMSSVTAGAGAAAGSSAPAAPAKKNDVRAMGGCCRGGVVAHLLLLLLRVSVADDDFG